MVVTERDKQIIKFILDMKFATIDDIHQRFFRNRKDRLISESQWWARERVRDLVKIQLLKAVRFRLDAKNYYMGTKRGFDLLESSAAIWDVAMPAETIDIRTFEHDKQLLRARIHLETTEEVSNWKSERYLKRLQSLSGNLQRFYAPDAIYTEKSGRIVGLEYEITLKSKERYREKAARYAYLMRDLRSEKPIHFDHCRFICEREFVARTIRDATRIYGDKMFSVELSPEQIFNRRADPVFELLEASRNA